MRYKILCEITMDYGDDFDNVEQVRDYITILEAEIDECVNIDVISVKEE